MIIAESHSMKEYKEKIEAAKVLGMVEAQNPIICGRVLDPDDQDELEREWTVFYPGIKVVAEGEEFFRATVDGRSCRLAPIHDDDEERIGTITAYFEQK